MNETGSEWAKGSETDAALTCFQKGPYTFHNPPELLFALENVMDVTIKLIRASSVCGGPF